MSDKGSTAKFLCTRKVRSELCLREKEVQGFEPGLATSADWYVNLLRIGSTKTLIFMHSATGYTVVACHCKRSDIKNMSILFADCLFRVLIAEGVSEAEALRFCALNSPADYHKTNNRQAVGTLADLTFLLNIHQRSLECLTLSSEISIALQLSRTPIKLGSKRLSAHTAFHEYLVTGHKISGRFSS